MLTVKQGISYVIESNPAHPIEFARICAQVAIKAGDLDEAVVWKQVIMAIQDQRNKEVMRPLADRGLGDDGHQIF
jgi:hypothetical protein